MYRGRDAFRFKPPSHSVNDEIALIFIDAELATKKIKELKEKQLEYHNIILAQHQREEVWNWNSEINYRMFLDERTREGKRRSPDTIH